MHWLISFPVLFLICALGGAALIFVGEPHSDEEYYFCAARNVARGHMPYRDFAFTQAPVSALAYAVPHKLFGPSFYAARATSLLFFMLQLLLVALTLIPVWGAAKTIDFSMPVERLKKLSARIAQMTGLDEKVWSLYPIPVNLADRDVFLEMSMGRRSFQHSWDVEKAEKLRWLGLEKALEYLRDPDTKVALLGDRDFRSLCPYPEPRGKIEKVLRDEYEVVETLRNFQAQMPVLTIYRKKAK